MNNIKAKVEEILLEQLEGLQQVSKEFEMSVEQMVHVSTCMAEIGTAIARFESVNDHAVAVTLDGDRVGRAVAKAIYDRLGEAGKMQ